MLRSNSMSLGKTTGTAINTDAQGTNVMSSYHGVSPDESVSLLNNGVVKTPHGTASRGSAIFNIVCTIAGTGILQLPYTLRLGGWVAVSILILSAFVADYSGRALVRCLYYNPEQRLSGYPMIGQAAFGQWGYYAVQFFHKSTLLGVCTIFLILAAGNMQDMLPQWGLSITEWTLICTAVVWLPVAFLKNMKEISLLSLFGMLASAIVVVVVVVLAFIDLDNMHEVSHDVIVWKTLGSSFAAITFSYGGNAVYPHVEESMAKPEQFNSALSISMVLVTAMYLPTAVVGYLVYGTETVSPILDNLIDTWATTLAIAVITAHVILAYPIPMIAVAAEAEPAISSLAERVAGTRSMGVQALEVLVRAVYRTLLVGLTLLVAIFVPYFAEFMTLLGAVCNCMLVFVLPIVFNWKLRGFYTQPIWERAYGALIVLIGVVGGGFGAYDAIVALINATPN